MTHECPVCEGELSFAPWVGVSASDEICPDCGIQFGYNDAQSDLRDRIYAAWRRAWISNGRRPFHGDDWREVSKRVAAEVKTPTPAG